MWSERNTQIDTLRVRGAGDNSLALRLGLANVLNSADLRPAGVAPSAVLIVRSVTDPLPGRLTPHYRAIRVDAAWEKAVQNLLAQVYRRASCPVRGYLPAGAEAVLFADEGEMLACLAMDIGRGEAWGRWWWKVILRTLPVLSSDGLKTLLCSKALYVPAVLHHLADWGKAGTVVNSLSPGQAMTVLSAMSRAYDMSDFSPDLVHSKEPSYDSPVSTMKAPWERWVPPRLVPQSLEKERGCLLGLGLTLYHEPAMVRTGAFLQALRDWWADQETSSNRKKDLSKDIEVTPHTGVSNLDLTAKSMVSQPEGVSNLDLTAKSLISQPEGVSNLDLTAKSLISQFPERNNDAIGVGSTKIPPNPPLEKGTRSFPPFRKGGLGGIFFKPPLKSTVLRDRGEGEVPQNIERAPIKQDDISDKDRVGSIISQIVEDESQEIESVVVGEKGEEGRDKRQGIMDNGLQVTEPIPEEGVITQLGGVLYLINLMRHLGLPACFEETWGLASQVGTWGVLEILGRAFLEQDAEHLTGDPLWKALTELDGREPGELPGETFHGSDNFRLPLNWFNQIRREDDRAYYWAANHQRLRLWSEQGYLLVDCPGNESASEVQARDELRAYAGNACRAPASKSFDQAPLDGLISPLVKGLNPNLARWLAMALPYIRLRLRQALNPSTTEEPDLLESLLRYRGRLYVTSTHVDLVMRLDDISLAARMAGLDCDPGWLPDFARVVQFYFE